MCFAGISHGSRRKGSLVDNGVVSRVARIVVVAVVVVVVVVVVVLGSAVVVANAQGVVSQSRGSQSWISVLGVQGCRQ